MARRRTRARARPGARRRTRARMRSRASRTWRWDDLGRLAEIHSSDREHATSVAVDALGELAEVGGAPLLWDAAAPHSPPAWIDGRAVIGHGAPWALAADGAAQPLAPDWQGTVGDAARDPWGAPLDAAGAASGLGLGYRGEVEIDGETWLRNRVYEPGTRSFLQPDPLRPVRGQRLGRQPLRLRREQPARPRRPARPAPRHRRRARRDSRHDEPRLRGAARVGRDVGARRGGHGRHVVEPDHVGRVRARPVRQPRSPTP